MKKTGRALELLFAGTLFPALLASCPFARATPVSVNIAPIANVHALVTDGSAVPGGGIDGRGNAYSSTLMGTSVAWQGIEFTIGAAGVADAVTHETLTLPANNYSRIDLLATGVNGDHLSQAFVVSYTDGTSTTFTQSLSDWFTPQHYTGEAIALSMPYRISGTGAKVNGPFYLFGYSFAINSAKTVKSITLPATSGVVVLSMELIPVSVVCNPLTFGAVPDGTTDNTTAIQNAINSCSSQGGGTVELGPSGKGIYVSGPIVLKSHVQLQVDRNVTLQGTNDHGRYVPAYLNWLYQSGEALISATGATGVGIIGSGVIDGAGGQLQPNGGPSWWTLAATENLATHPSVRPYLVEFYQCDHVTVTGVTLRNSPYWTQVFRFSDTVTESGTTITAPGTSPNTDGLDLVGATNVNLSNLTIATGDDSIAIKSGLPINASDPRQVGLPRMATQHVYIGNVSITGGHGLSVGSEAVNGVNDVTVQGVTYFGAGNGVRIKTARDRGGRIFGLTFKDLTMTAVSVPITINSYYPSAIPPAEPPYDPSRPITGTTPSVHDITIQNLTATGANAASTIDGLPESCIHNVTLNNVKIQTSGKGMTLRHMTGTFSDVTVTPGSGPPFIVQENVTVTTSGTTPRIPATPPESGQTGCGSQVVR